MATYIILLRGVMPTGKNKVHMAPLRDALAKAGLYGVRTYIQSGNVLARSALAAPAVERLVHDVIRRRFGGDIAVLARTPVAFKRIFDANPFKNKDPQRVYFTLLAAAPAPAKVKAAAALDFAPDEFAVTPRAVYVHCPDGYARTKINNMFFERKLGVAATTRNHNTMTALLALSRA